MSETFQLMRHERRIRRNHDDDRAEVLIFVARERRRRQGRRRVGRQNLRGDWHTGNPQRPAMVGLHENADRVAAGLRRQLPRRCARSNLNP
jgi:hypothetical protein